MQVNPVPRGEPGSCFLKAGASLKFEQVRKTGACTIHGYSDAQLNIGRTHLRPNMAFVALTWVEKMLCKPLANWLTAFILYE